VRPSNWPRSADPVDRASLQAPALPQDRNSLHVGWYWKNGKLAHDSHHAGLQGDTLAGLVWYATLTGADVRTLTPEIPGLAAEDLAFLAQIAHAVVVEGVRPAIQPAVPAAR